MVFQVLKVSFICFCGQMQFNENNNLPSSYLLVHKHTN